MPNLSKLVLGTALALFVAKDIKLRITSYQAAKCYLDAYEGFKELKQIDEARIQYLIHLLEENEIPPSEFDLIVLNDPM